MARSARQISQDFGPGFSGDEHEEVHMRLAIVGSTQFHKDRKLRGEAAAVIRAFLDDHQPELVISGGAVGIDQLAEKTAHQRGIETKIFYPENPRWAPYGYKARNMEIAVACTDLLCIRHHDSTTFGSGWTANYAEGLGRNVTRITL